MRKVSFNIPTYNRVSFLQKNLDILISQIRENHLENDVEINISDNCSTDSTEDVCCRLIENNKTLCINYQRNKTNLGPDCNFLAAMKMATGEYSLLWGDDDYLKPNGIQRILELINLGEKENIQILVSSTSIIDEKGDYIREKFFLREDISEMIVDFSDINSVRSYFFLMRDMGGLLSFISDVVYKTSIINLLPYDVSYTGTHYAFLNYWWGWLAKGNKLYYSNEAFLEETIQYQKAYGNGVDRVLIDYKAYVLISDTILKNKEYRQDFLDCFNAMHDLIFCQMIYAGEKKDFEKVLLPQLSATKHEKKKIEAFLYNNRLSTHIRNVIQLLLPNNITKLIREILLKN